MCSTKTTTWIGLVAVTGPANHPQLACCPGAFVNAISISADAEGFLTDVKAAVNDMGLNLDQIVWSEPLSERLRRYDVDQYLLDLARDIRKPGDVLFGIFHAWKE